MSRCGCSPLRWPKNDSIQAWSLGVAGRPKWVAIRAPARNAFVEREVICGPLSDNASSTGSSRPWPDWAELVPGVIWIYDFTHFRASRRCAVAVLDVVSRLWLATVVSAEESSTQVEVAFTRALTTDGKDHLLDICRSFTQVRHCACACSKDPPARRRSLMPTLERPSSVQLTTLDVES